MNRRDFLAALGLTALAPSLLKGLTDESPPREFRVARMTLYPTLEVDENGQRIGQRHIHEAQTQSYVNMRMVELPGHPNGFAALCTRADGTVDEFHLDMETVEESNVTRFRTKDGWRIVGYRAIEVATINMAMEISRNVSVPPGITITWQEAHWA